MKKPFSIPDEKDFIHNVILIYACDRFKDIILNKPCTLVSLCNQAYLDDELTFFLVRMANYEPEKTKALWYELVARLFTRELSEKIKLSHRDGLQVEQRMLDAYTSSIYAIQFAEDLEEARIYFSLLYPKLSGGIDFSALRFTEKIYKVFIEILTECVENHGIYVHDEYVKNL